jgi:hypothetical protein
MQCYFDTLHDSITVSVKELTYCAGPYRYMAANSIQLILIELADVATRRDAVFGLRFTTI